MKTRKKANRSKANWRSRSIHKRMAYEDKRRGTYTEPLPDYGDLMTVKEFLISCKNGNFIDYDGSGHPVKNKMMARIDIYPSNLEAIPKDATHIMWFNK